MKKIITVLLFMTIILAFSSCMMFLPKGEFMESVESPTKEYTINSYLCSGNATTGFSVRCEAVNNHSGKARNIYWQYKCKTADIYWLDDFTVSINGIKLNVKTDSYDWRNQ